MAIRPNALLYGDNIDWLPKVESESIDLVYLDPPFNSNKIYNIIFQRHGDDDVAQIQAFDDTWRWTPATEEQYESALAGGVPAKVADALRAFRTLSGTSNLLAYLVNMAPRLVELHRVLKQTGSIYLHCDPTASHYLKILMDAIFGQNQFQNEVVWAYRGGGVSKKRFGRKHDVVLFYAKIAGSQYFSPQYVPYSESTQQVTGRTGTRVNKTAIDLERGGHMPDWWTDINALQTWSPERLGYPTQKPEALVRRMIDASCPPGGTVLDPFCGCGTAVVAAARSGRSWIGIDITYLAVHLIRERLLDTFGEDLADNFETLGIPRDLLGAEALFKSSAFDFERWAVSLVSGTPNQRQVGDHGIDGLIRFPVSRKGSDVGKIVVSVKGGRTVGPTAVRDLAGTLSAEDADMGLLVTMGDATRGVREACASGGYYVWPPNGQRFPKLQVLSVKDLINFKRPDMPPPYPPYREATPRGANHVQLSIEE